MKVEVGKIYKHFKGHKYKVLFIAYDSNYGLDDTKRLVIYQDINSEDLIWARPIEEFTSLVDNKKYPDVKQKYRFEKIEI
jgi:hypothetical protein